MLYHASPVPGLAVLSPHVSNHGKALVYLSAKKENVLVYLSNAVEKYCRETGFAWKGPWRKWASYGFTKDGLLLLEEYYPDAVWETYHGVSGYLYQVADHAAAIPQDDIRDAFVSSEALRVTACEFVPDAYEAIMEAASNGQLVIRRYEEMSEGMHRWLEKAIQQDYASAEDHPEYRYFLQSKFSFLNPG